MASDALPPEYTFEGRLASFKKSVPGLKRRGSTARGTKGGGNLTWPHAKYLPAERLAAAGFSWQPHADNPDNVTCFLCEKSLDGWEQGDDPLEEHISHSPQCGWAIVAAIEAGYGDMATRDPREADMIDARKATFAGRWPHEGRRGWKCKTKQLAEAGWKWTPSLEYDDMATCTYCELALDGWEQGDKPWDEHHNRSPDCAFFTLIAQNPPPKKTKGKAAASRNSKASRTSVQSVATTTAEDATSIAGDMPTEIDDTVLTTASTATTGKKGRPKKAATTAKGRKTKAKKDEPVEVFQDEPDADEEPPVPAPAPKAKSARGRKRGSDAVEDSVVTKAEAPAPKKRATKNRGSVTVESSVIEPSQADVDMEEAPAPAPAKGKGGRKTTRASNARTTRKASTTSTKSRGSAVSAHTAPGAFPDDDEIDRQLEADLERPLTDDEDIMHDSDSERLKKTPAAKGKAKSNKGQAQKKDVAVSEGSKIWLDADPHVDEAEVEDELDRLQDQLAAEQAAAEQAAAEQAAAEQAAAEQASAEAAAREHEQEQEPESLEVPKKGRKTGGTRKASKQTKAKQTKQAKAAAQAAVEETPHEPEPVPEPVPEPEPEHQAEIPASETEVEEVSLVAEPSPAVAEEQDSSSATVANNTSKARTSTGRKRGRPSKAEVAARLSAQKAEEERAEAEAAEAAAAAAQAEQEAVDAETEGVDEIAEELEEIAEDEVAVPDFPAPPSSVLSEQDQHEQTPEPTVPTPRSRTVAVTSSPTATDKLPTSPAAIHILADSPSPAPSDRTLQNQNPPTTPASHASPAASARQPAVSPSPSPQPSDAENQPPSSVKPTPATTKKRVALAPVVTPGRPNNGAVSPSKRNVIAGLRSKAPWTAVDVDLVLGAAGSPEKKTNGGGGGEDKENGGVETLLAKGGTLSSPEKRMTVEQWIYFNAEKAEEKLKSECEGMVSRFESEGGRAMRALEEMVVD